MMQDILKKAKLYGIFRIAAVAGVLFALGALSVSIYSSRENNNRIYRQLCRVNEDISRIKMENADLRRELEAIDTDPLFLKSLLAGMNLSRKEERILR